MVMSSCTGEMLISSVHEAKQKVTAVTHAAACCVTADLLPDSVLAYESPNAQDPANPYVIIQYTVAASFKPLLTGEFDQLGQFQIYFFNNGDIGYVSPQAKGANAAIGKLADDVEAL